MHVNTRRGFLTGALAASAAAQSNPSPAGLPTRPLGRSGVKVSILGLGGAHMGRIRDEAEAIRLTHMAIDEGMTFMDNAWEYNRGRSEELMGKALAMDGYRNKAFLMTKVCSREYKGAMEQIEDSLKKLQTGHIDLLQFHECNYHNDAEWIVEKGGLKALLEAKKQGKIRFIGFTGHKAPSIHLKMLGVNYPWDACQMPNNIMDSRFLSFRHEVMPVCQKRGVGVIGMKGCGGDAKMIQAGLVSVEECYRYFLAQPVSTQVVGLNNVEELKTALRIARDLKPLSPAEMQTILSRVKEAQGDGRFELFKSSKRYDSAYHRTQHGFETQGL